MKELIAEIKATQDIVDYIQSAAVSLKPSSAGKYKGLCPFHSEKSPSFYVDSNFQNYKCFGCGESGDLVSFVQQYENLGFRDSVKKLAEIAGIDYDLDDDGPSFDYKAIRHCVQAAHDFFVKNFSKLDNDHIAKKDILVDRGLELDSMDYGYSAESKTSLYKHLKSKGFSDDVILQAGLATKWEKTGNITDFWNGRLMFTIKDPTGKPVGFSGRKLFDTDKRGKYVNSPDGPVFDKSSVLFNQSEAKMEAKDTATIYVSEGQFDVVAIATSGLPNVVASSGTAFTKKQLLMCSRMVGETGKIIFCFDGDAAGKKAAYKIFSMAEELQSQCYVVSLPKGEDPCDFRKKRGPKKLRKYLESKAVSIVDFVLDVIAERYDLSEPAQVSRYVEEAAVVLKTVSSPSLRATYSKRVALRSMMSVSTIDEAVAKAKSSKDLPQRAPVKNESTKEKTPSREEYISFSEKEERFIADLSTNKIKELYARLLQLSLQRRDLIPKFLEVPDCPKPFLLIAKEVSKLPDSSAIIAERSKLPLVLATVIEQEYFPYLNQMDEKDVSDLFDSINNEAITMRALNNMKKNSRRVMEVLRGSKDPELLRIAESGEHNGG